VNKKDITLSIRNKKRRNTISSTFEYGASRKFRVFQNIYRRKEKGYLKKESITIIWVCFLL
jgi:hypothetical protein